MNLITLDNIKKTQGDKLLFQSISLGINEGDKIALVGVNGCGKSTLLKIIQDLETADQGSISRNKFCKISTLNQVPEYNPEDTILAHIFKSDDPKVNLIKQYEICTENLENNPQQPKMQKELENLIHRMDIENAWEYEREIKSVLDQLKITDLDKPMKDLSGGMLKKVSLAQCLVADSNLLILDEPTNHLDLETINWLENYLSKKVKTLIMVTHDRYFLDRVCNQIVEIDHQKLYVFQGNYSYYLEKKSEIQNSLQQEDNKIQSILRNELVWLSRGPKARGTKQKARIERIDEMRNKDKIQNQDSLELNVMGRRLGNKILELQEISKAFQHQPVIKDFSYTFKKNEKIGIIGPNGSGKTTLLNLITGKISPDSGKIDTGINTHFGFFDQNAMHLNPELRVIDFIRQSSEHITLSDGETLSAGKMLEKFLFPLKQQSAFIGKLSGGERRRLYLLHILMKNPNFLLLDEPTNDLDIKTLSILEDFLERFSGCVILVSHDRYFMDRLADTLLVFTGNGNIQLFNGNYSDYLDAADQEPPIKKQAPDPKKKDLNPVKSEKKKLSFNEKREYQSIEKDIDLLEQEKTAIELKFQKGNWDDLNTKRHKEIEELLLQKMERWEYLSGFEE